VASSEQQQGQFVVTNRYTLLQEREKNLTTSSIDQQVGMLCFLRKYKEKQFFGGHKILAETVILTHLSSNAGISI
jgi:hypothetical protein